jgi:ATP-dependent protease Clp ATPase subunit
MKNLLLDQLSIYDECIEFCAGIIFETQLSPAVKNKSSLPSPQEICKIPKLKNAELNRFISGNASMETNPWRVK